MASDTGMDAFDMAEQMPVPTVAPMQIPDLPHMPEAGIEWLSKALRSSSCFLEFGAGGSTVLAASQAVRRIYSVESDPAFLSAVSEKISSSGSSSQFFPIHVDIGPTGEWGVPTDPASAPKWPNYPLDIWTILQTHQLLPDLVLVDGRFRVACALASILHCLPGTLIMLDDYVGREHDYQVITRHARLTALVGVAAIFRVLDRPPMPELAVALTRYSMRQG